MNSRLQRWLVRRLVPGGLLALSVGTAFLAGTVVTRTDGSSSVWQASAFAMFVLLGVGGHAFGHFVMARRHGVDASFPYFVPQLGISGTGGAYVKLRWPIDDRRALIRIVAAGPIAGSNSCSVAPLSGRTLVLSIHRADKPGAHRRWT